MKYRVKVYTCLGIEFGFKNGVYMDTTTEHSTSITSWIRMSPSTSDLKGPLSLVIVHIIFHEIRSLLKYNEISVQHDIPSSGQ